MATLLHAADRAAIGATGADLTRGAPTRAADPRGERLALTAGALALTVRFTAVHTLRLGKSERRGSAPCPVARVPDLRALPDAAGTSR